MKKFFIFLCTISPVLAGEFPETYSPGKALKRLKQHEQIQKTCEEMKQFLQRNSDKEHWNTMLGSATLAAAHPNPEEYWQQRETPEDVIKAVEPCLSYLIESAASKRWCTMYTQMGKDYLLCKNVKEIASQEIPHYVEEIISFMHEHKIDDPDFLHADMSIARFHAHTSELNLAFFLNDHIFPEVKKRITQENIQTFKPLIGQEYTAQLEQHYEDMVNKETQQLIHRLKKANFVTSMELVERLRAHVNKKRAQQKLNTFLEKYSYLLDNESLNPDVEQVLDEQVEKMKENPIEIPQHVFDTIMPVLYSQYPYLKDSIKQFEVDLKKLGKNNPSLSAVCDKVNSCEFYLKSIVETSQAEYWNTIEKNLEQLKKEIPIHVQNILQLMKLNEPADVNTLKVMMDMISVETEDAQAYVAFLKKYVFREVEIYLTLVPLYNQKK